MTLDGSSGMFLPEVHHFSIGTTKAVLLCFPMIALGWVNVLEPTGGRKSD